MEIRKVTSFLCMLVVVFERQHNKTNKMTCLFVCVEA